MRVDTASELGTGERPNLVARYVKDYALGQELGPESELVDNLLTGAARKIGQESDLVAEIAQQHFDATQAGNSDLARALEDLMNRGFNELLVDPETGTPRYQIGSQTKTRPLEAVIKVADVVGSMDSKTVARAGVVATLAAGTFVSSTGIATAESFPVEGKAGYYAPGSGGSISETIEEVTGQPSSRAKEEQVAKDSGIADADLVQPDTPLNLSSLLPENPATDGFVIGVVDRGGSVWGELGQLGQLTNDPEINNAKVAEVVAGNDLRLSINGHPIVQEGQELRIRVNGNVDEVKPKLVGYSVQEADSSLTQIAQDRGIDPTPSNLKRIGEASGLNDINDIKTEDMLYFPADLMPAAETAPAAPEIETEQITAGEGSNFYFENMANAVGLSPDEFGALNPHITDRSKIIAGSTVVNIPKGKAALLMSQVQSSEASADAGASDINPEIPSDITSEQLKAAIDYLISRGPQWENRARLMHFLMTDPDLCLSATQAAGFATCINAEQATGFIGNLVVEAGGTDLDPAVQQFSGGPGRGIVQWEGIRRTQLEEFAAARGTSWEDRDTQFEFIKWELLNTERGAFLKLVKAKTVEEAAYIILNFYERPAARIVEPRADHAVATLEGFKLALAVVTEEEQTEVTTPPPATDESDQTDSETAPVADEPEVEPPIDQPAAELETPDDPEARKNFLANQLDISPDQISVSTNKAGIYRFIVDPSAHKKLGIAPIGGYPADWQFASGADNYRMYKGECVSYVQWKIDKDSHPGASTNWGGNRSNGYRGGNAKDWVHNAQIDGITVNKTPAVGSAIVWNGQTGEHTTEFGHVAYVEAILPDGNILISEMNYDGKSGFFVRVLAKQYLQSESMQQGFDFVHFEAR